MKLPMARNENTVVQNLKDEVLIYDLITNKAYCLNETLAKVFNHCDGKTSIDELKQTYKLTDDLIYFALDELRKENLLADTQSHNYFQNLTRREIIKRVGLASMIALPVITGITAPKAAQAQSVAFAPGSRNVNDTCNTSTDCASTAPNCVDTSNSVGHSTGTRCCVVSGGFSIPSGQVAATGFTQAACNTLPTNFCCRGAGTTLMGSGSCVCN